jgi:anti-sigma factor (TIGR02949 family)
MKEYATCIEAREEFSALLDGELEIENQDGLERHLAECSECLRELDSLKKVSDAYETLPNVSAPDDLADEIRQGMEPSQVDLSDSPRSAKPVSFKPVVVAVLVLAALAILSFLISQGATLSGDGDAPALVEETE